MANHLRVARERLGLSQAQLAERIGSRQPSISRYERGSLPMDTELITKLAEALQISREHVIFGDDKAAA
jgi:transcriptional regulator with XRE-family HTH domain